MTGRCEPDYVLQILMGVVLVKMFGAGYALLLFVGSVIAAAAWKVFVVGRRSGESPP